MRKNQTAPFYADDGSVKLSKIAGILKTSPVKAPVTFYISTSYNRHAQIVPKVRLCPHQNKGLVLIYEFQQGKWHKVCCKIQSWQCQTFKDQIYILDKIFIANITVFKSNFLYNRAVEAYSD